MSPKKLYFALLATITFMIIGSFGLVWEASNWLSKRGQSTVNLKLDILGLEQKQKAGIRATNDLLKYKQDIANLESVIPTQKDQVDALSQLIKIGDENGVTFGSITFPSSELGNVVAPKPVAVTTEDTKATAPALTPSTTPAPQAAPKKTITQAKPVEGVPGLYEIQIALSDIAQKSTSKGLTYEQLLSLLRSIEQNKRIMQMNTISITPQKSTTDSSILYLLTISLKIYIRQ